MWKALTLLLALTAPAAQDLPGYEAERARLDAWGERMGARLTSLLPDPIDGLDEWSPWDYQFREPPIYGCPAGCTVLTQVIVSRPYVVKEPGLVERVAAAEVEAAVDYAELAKLLAEK